MSLYTKLLLPGDGADASTTILDSEAGTKKTVTAVGNAQIDTAQYKFGTGSILFDGTGDYLSLADSDDWTYGTDPFTIDFWIRFTDLTNNQGIYEQRADSSNYFAIAWVQATARIYFDYTVSAGGQLRWYYSWSPSVNTWYHVAIVRTGATTVNVYIDGTGGATTVYYDLGGNLNDISAALHIGDASASYSYGVNGWIDEFRISKGIAKWTSNFTPPTSAYASEELTFTETITISETFKKITGYKKRFTDSVATSDAYVDVFGVIRRFLESMVITDNLSKSKGQRKTLLDSMTLADLITLIRGKGKLFLDTITLTDVLKKDISKWLLDSVSLTDKIKKDISKRLLDSVTLTDLIKVIRGYSRNFTDTVVLADILSKLVAYRKTFSDTITLSDLLTKLIQRTKGFSDTITITDTFSKRAVISFKFNDSMLFTDRPFTFVEAGETIVDISKNPQISAGEKQGDMLTLHHTSDLPKLRIASARGVSLMGAGNYIMGSGDTLNLVYQTDNSVWQESSRGKYL